MAQRTVNGDVITIKELVEGQNTFNDVVRAFTGDGSTTGFTVSSGKTVDWILVLLMVFSKTYKRFYIFRFYINFWHSAQIDVISVKELAESAGNLLTIVDDSSTTTGINQGESLKITGSGGVTTSLSGDTLTIAGKSS